MPKVILRSVIKTLIGKSFSVYRAMTVVEIAAIANDGQNISKPRKIGTTE